MSATDLDGRVHDLADLLRGRRIVALAGAGMSTESGIPDYRGPDGRLQKRGPIQYAEFVGSDEARARYWARSAVGWPRMAGARPNEAHLALARMEEAGVAVGVITQNVDGLHQAAGSRRVVELHGSLADVLCIDCGARTTRAALQRRLERANPGWVERVLEDGGGAGAGQGGAAARVVRAAPDGDAELRPEATRDFSVPPCPACGGRFKPDVVFFGEGVPKPTVERAWGLFGEGDALLVLGSSLTVFSGRRFVLRAAAEGVPVAIVTLGPTRGDDVASAKVEGRLGTVLPRLAEALAG